MHLGYAAIEMGLSVARTGLKPGVSARPLPTDLGVPHSDQAGCLRGTGGAGRQPSRTRTSNRGVTELRASAPAVVPAPDRTRMPHHIFISYSSKDRSVADAVCAGLESSGLRCWIAPRDIDFGARFEAEIVNAIKGSSAMVLLFSGHANASDGVLNEVRIAYNQKGMLIIPLRIENVPPSETLEWYLGGTQWQDVVPSELSAHLPRLVSRLLRLVPPT